MSSAQTSQPFGPTSSGALKLNYVASDNAGENAYTYFPLHPFTTPSAEGGVVPLRISPFQIPRRQPMLSQLNEAEPPSDIVLRIGNHLVTESSKLTPALVGERFVEPTLIDYKGKKCLVFVFGVCLFFECCFGRTDRRLTGSFHVFLCYILSVNTFRGMLNWLGIQDLAVQREGTFIFRYRAFDIFSTVPGGQEQPVLAELYGGPFRVYSTREFPGLEPSTDLTRVRVFFFYEETYC